MSEKKTAADTLRVLVYSDDRNVRQEIRLALGTSIAADLPPVEMTETATQKAAMAAVDTGQYDVVIADGEAVPSGGMGVTHQMKDEVDDCPPVVLLVAGRPMPGSRVGHAPMRSPSTPSTPSACHRPSPPWCGQPERRDSGADRLVAG